MDNANDFWFDGIFDTKLVDMKLVDNDSEMPSVEPYIGFALDPLFGETTCFQSPSENELLLAQIKQLKQKNADLKQTNADLKQTIADLKKSKHGTRKSVRLQKMAN